MISNLKLFQIVLLFFLIEFILLINCQQIRIQTKDASHLIKHDDSYIVNIKKVVRSNSEFKLYCSCKTCISLTLSLNNVKFDVSESSDQVTVGGIEVSFKRKFDILNLFSTGLYTCKGKLSNGQNEIVENYIYFYPDDGNLFIPKPYSTVMYRLRLEFAVPCIALHPSVVVQHDVNADFGKFDYNPKAGLVGVLNKESKDLKTIQCIGLFDGFLDNQEYTIKKIELKDFTIKTSNNINPVYDNYRHISIISAIKGSEFEITCHAEFDCSYHSYDIVFNYYSTGSTEFIIDNQIKMNRTLCISKSLVIVDKTMIVKNLDGDNKFSCSLVFTRNKMSKSDEYHVYLSERHFIKFVTEVPNKSVYTVAFGSPTMVTTSIDMNATALIEPKWFLNSKAININDTSKYNTFCLQLDTLEHTCELQIFTFSEEDAGLYTFEGNLIIQKNIKISHNFTLLFPKKPEITIVRPKACSANYTCEYDKNIEFVCNSNAHSIEKMIMFSVPCKSLDDCYLLIKDKLDDLLDEYLQYNPDAELYNPFDTNNIGFLSYKHILTANQPNLVICASENDVGKTIRSVIMIPSTIESGKTGLISYKNLDRDDNEVVEGDSFIIKFDYNNFLFDNKTLKFTRPNVHCLFKIIENYTEFTNSYTLKFNDVTQMCTNLYSFTINSKVHPYLNATYRRNDYNISVLKSQPPVFMQLLNLTTNNQSVISFTEVGENSYKIVTDDDQSIMLDCKAEGKPFPSVVWYRNLTLLNTTDEKYSTTDRIHKLRILRSHSSDSGIYECHVKNRIGINKRVFDVLVKSSVISSGKLSKKQKALIGFVSTAACILLVLLVIAIVYVIFQKRKNDKLKAYHEKLLKFLNYEGPPIENFDEIETFLNTNLENLARLEYDDNWEVEPTHFYIDENKVLGQGNFGRVCVAYISRNEPIRDEEEVKKESVVKQVIKRRTSFKIGKLTNNQIYEPSGGLDSTTNNIENESAIPLLPKNSRKAAAKMAKDYKVNSSNIDSLLQELKIMAYINNPITGQHLNIIQLIGSCTTQLLSQGIAYVFVEYCENGDLKSWLQRKSKNGKYSKDSDPKLSLIQEYKKRISRTSTGIFDPTNASKPKIDEFMFNDTDLVFFCFQIAKGMEFLAKKRLLHRDLAARNILLTKHFECKISDFGLADESKIKYLNFFGTAKDTKIPAKWTAPEVFKNLRYEGNSDVWSFGITIWEILTLGEKDPYPNVPNTEFKDYKEKLFDGIEELETPENGSNEIHNLMRKCLTVDYQNRPDFRELVPELEKHVSDVHKHYYTQLNENFRLQSNEWKKYNSNFRRSNNQSNRNSNIRSNVPTNDQYINTANYIKPETYTVNSDPYETNNSDDNNNNNNKNNNNNYNNNNNNTQDREGGRYLEPELPKSLNIPDTYGGIEDYDNNQNIRVNNTDDRYLEPNNPRVSNNPRNSSETTKLNPPVRPPIPFKPEFLKQKSLTNNDLDRYLVPQQGSGISNISNGSIESTTLLNTNPNPMPRKKKIQNTFQRNNTNETDI